MDFIIENAMKHGEGLDNNGLQVGQANIKAIGCGGAGNNMVNWLYKKGVKGAVIQAQIGCWVGKYFDKIIQPHKFWISQQIPFLEGEPDGVAHRVGGKDEETDQEGGSHQVSGDPLPDNMFRWYSIFQ